MKNIPSIKELQEICQKKSYSDFHEKINRKLSIYLTKGLLIFGFTANQVSWLNIFLGILASLLFLINYNIYWFIVPIMFCLCSILDHSDGEIARFRGKSCLTGLFIDRLFPIIAYPFLFICISIRVFLNDPTILSLAIGLLTLWNVLLCRLLISYTSYCAMDGILNPKKVRNSYNSENDSGKNRFSSLQKKWQLNLIFGNCQNRIIIGVMKTIEFMFNKILGISFILLILIILEANEIEIIGFKPFFLFLIVNLLVFLIVNLRIIIKTIKSQTPDKLYKNLSKLVKMNRK